MPDRDDDDDGRRPRRRRDRDDEDDDRPRARRRDAAGDDDRPRRRMRDEDADDESDRPRRRRRPVGPLEDQSLAGVLPVNTPPLAIAAGYLGLVSVLCFPAPFALLTGILALRQLRRDRKLMGYSRALLGIVAGGLGTGLLAFFLIAAAFGGR